MKTETKKENGAEPEEVLAIYEKIKHCAVECVGEPIDGLPNRLPTAIGALVLVACELAVMFSAGDKQAAQGIIELAVSTVMRAALEHIAKLKEDISEEEA